MDLFQIEALLDADIKSDQPLDSESKKLKARIKGLERFQNHLKNEFEEMMELVKEIKGEEDDWAEERDEGADWPKASLELTER